MTNNKLRELDNCCCDIIQYFSDLNCKIAKIIEAKNKQANSGVVKNVENLLAINSKIIDSRDKIVQLHQQISKEAEDIEVAGKAKKIIEDLLATGDWERSAFLKASFVKIKEFCTKLESFIGLDGSKKTEYKGINKTLGRKAVPSGYLPVFVLLYQADGSNLNGWYQNIKMLAEYKIARPVYKNESYVQEIIRSKPSNIVRNGYVVINVKEDDFYTVDQSLVDAFGHQLFTLKEKAIELKNIVEFVHANKKFYAICGEKIVFLKEV